MSTITENQESSESENRLLSSEERAILSQIATKEPPYSQRAQALLAIDEGATQAEAGIRAGLTKGQLRYWLGKFRKDGTAIFPEELLSQAQPEDAGEEEAQQDLLGAEETAEPIPEATVQQGTAPKSKKKSKKAKKTKQANKKKKGKKPAKKTKKNKSKKVKGTKGKSSKKRKKNPKK